MGNWLVTRPPETNYLGVAPFRSPFTDITAPIGHHDGDRCFSFQLRWIDCCEAYGKEMALEKCKFLYQDFCECSRNWKQLARVEQMMEQRYHLWFKGIRNIGPKVDLFYETPKYDSYAPNMMYEDTHYNLRNAP